MMLWLPEPLKIARVSPFSSNSASFEPLFVHNRRLWVRLWAGAQIVAILVATYVASARGGAAPIDTRFAIAATLLIAYHVVGLIAYDLVLRRRAAVVLFVAAGWALFLWSVSLHSAFGLLMFGLFIQVFIFLPVGWAVAALSLVIVLLCTRLLLRERLVDLRLRIAQVAAIVTTGITIGTVMLYIHGANRQASIRTRLLEQLAEAQRDLAERAKQSGIQEERQRLARDLHDTLAQGFASVIRHLDAIELSYAAFGDTNNPARSVQFHLTKAREVSRASLEEIRHVVLALRPEQLVGATIGTAVERLVSRWAEASRVEARCRVEALPTLDPDAEVLFLRAAQETLSNVARHAEASCVSVTMQCVEGIVLLTIEDNGSGMVTADAIGAENLGIAGMRDRVRRVGGHLLIESAPGEGTSVTLAIPLDRIAASYA